jgi:hypothetical protein
VTTRQARRQGREVRMVIGVVPTTSHAETLLNNLQEADFKRGDVSVIMRDQKMRDTIANDAGPFKGVSLPQLPVRLSQAGLSNPEAKAYGDAVTQGGIFVAIRGPKPADPAAAEMLKDASANMIKVLP